jgi:hypothetical protein
MTKSPGLRWHRPVLWLLPNVERLAIENGSRKISSLPFLRNIAQSKKSIILTLADTGALMKFGMSYLLQTSELRTPQNEYRRFPERSKNPELATAPSPQLATPRAQTPFFPSHFSSLKKKQVSHFY